MESNKNSAKSIRLLLLRAIMLFPKLSMNAKLKVQES